MYVRLTFINFLPENKEEAKRIYKAEIVPVVRQQKGNLNIILLEPANEADDYISITEWETKADGDAYESSGTYRRLVDLVKDKFTKRPELKTYTAEIVGSMSAV